MGARLIEVQMSPSEWGFDVTKDGMTAAFSLIDAVTARNRLAKAIGEEEQSAESSKHSMPSVAPLKWKEKYLKVLHQVWVQWAATVGEGADVESLKLAQDFAHFLKAHNL